MPFISVGRDRRILEKSEDQIVRIHSSFTTNQQFNFFKVLKCKICEGYATQIDWMHPTCDDLNRCDEHKDIVIPNLYESVPSHYNIVPYSKIREARDQKYLYYEIPNKISKWPIRLLFISCIIMIGILLYFIFK